MGSQNVLAICLIALSAGMLHLSEASAQITSEEQQLVNLVNQARSQRGLRPLSVDGNLVNSARSWSGTMHRQGKMYHSGMAGRAENVAFGYNDAYNTFRQWMNSPPHYATMMSPQYSRIGVGRSAHYWTLQASGGGVVVPASSQQQRVIHQTPTTMIRQ